MWELMMAFAFLNSTVWAIDAYLHNKPIILNIHIGLLGFTLGASTIMFLNERMG